MADKEDIVSCYHGEDVPQGKLQIEDSLSPEEDRRLLRKIDWFLLPVMAFSYFFQFLDKSALAGSSILGIRTELHLTGSNYSWASAIYYFGYLIAAYPASLLMVRWKVGKVIALSVLSWGTVLMATAACRNAGALLAVRFLLGACEAPIAVGLGVIIPMWYKRSEQPLRHAAWFLGNTLAGILGAFISYGIAHIQGISPWKAVFLINGGATVAWSVAVTFLLPDVPMRAWFLTPADRVKAVVRIQENMTGIKSNHFKGYQVLEALRDPKTWLLCVIQLSSNIPNGGLTSFGVIVTNGMGFSTFNTLLLGGLSYIFQAFLVLLATGGSSYLRNSRTYWMIWNFAIAILGILLLRQLPHSMRWGRFIGKCLGGSFTANFPMVMAMISSNIGGFTKKTSVNAMVFMAYCVGNIIGPNLFFDNEAPNYNSGFLSMLICYGVGVLACVVLRIYLIHENKRRDQAVEPGLRNEATTIQLAQVLDKTDKEIPEFRYIY